LVEHLSAGSYACHLNATGHFLRFVSNRTLRVEVLVEVKKHNRKGSGRVVVID
jgi:hypothetical protein